MSKSSNVFKGDEDIQYLQELLDSSRSSEDELSEDGSDFSDSDLYESCSSYSESNENDVPLRNVRVNDQNNFSEVDVNDGEMPTDDSNMEIVDDPMIDVPVGNGATEELALQNEHAISR